MFLYRVKVEELTAQSRSLLKMDLSQGEQNLRAHCPIREMNVVADDGNAKGQLDIYLALDDFIDGMQVRRLLGELRAMITLDVHAAKAAEPRVSTELIHI
jgi:hypothetical protein